MEQYDPAFLTETNPDEEMAILDQLLELQQNDQDFDAEQKKGTQELKQMEGELAEQEGMLLQLRESLKVYHNMKSKYEKLMLEVQQLEVEKTQLAEMLEKASADPTQGCSVAIKKDLEKVERSLARARTETRNHRQMCRKAEQEAQKCRVLERKIGDLKTKSVSLIKKQKEAAAKHREYTETKTREIMALKKKERAAEQKMTKLESEIQIHKKNLDKRQDYCTKLTSKLKDTEKHLMKLLSMRQREHGRNRATGSSRRRPAGQQAKTASSKESGTFAPESEAIKSIQFLVDKAVADRVSHESVKQQYEECVNEYSETMRSLVDTVRKLEDATAGDDESVDETVRELEQMIEEQELKVELLGTELESLRSQLNIPEDDEEDESDQMESVKKLVADKDSPVLRTLLLNSVQKVAEVEVSHTGLHFSILAVDATSYSARFLFPVGTQETIPSSPAQRIRYRKL
jgi:myosin heavy subunit